jgi:hypothetical protein
MIDAIIRGSLGEFWSSILDFYIQYSFWINGIILFYALILVLAKRGYSKIKEVIIQEIIKQFGEAILSKNENNFRKSMIRSDLDWKWVADQTRIPIISTSKSLIFRIKSAKFLKEHFTPERLYNLLKSEKAEQEA